MSNEDREITIRLDTIEGAANWLIYDAGQIQSAIRGLTWRRPFETRARDTLNQAETNLKIALSLVKATQEIYDNLPVEINDYTISEQDTQHEGVKTVSI